jgi:pSer/pThr/pTyr-binding forkhead associated (FHA) protein
MPGQVMEQITLRILDGADRGRVFQCSASPVTIGREEGNTIQLNDERVSRFHLKIQRDHDDLVLTDLASTNGTRVNGEDAHLRILRHGDLISVGRSTLIYGSRQEINERLKKIASSPEDASQENTGDKALESRDWEKLANQTDVQLKLMEIDPPKLPVRLSPGQAAQLAEVLEYIHLHMRRLVNSVKIEPRSSHATMDIRQWHQLIDMQARMAEYIRQISGPDG